MDIKKLERAIVDGLEDVKGQDILVFDTERLSPLFERVIIASGTSNRQTKALASSVRETVKKRGMQVMRTEGEDNGEWIIVDCGAAVVHLMQPAIRQYYHLEEIWGDKPVRLKLGASKPARASEDKKETKPAAAKAPTSLRRASAAKTAIRAAEREAKEAKAAPKKAAGKTAAKTAAKKAPAKKAPVVVVGKPVAKKAAAKKTVAKPAAKKAPARKTASRSA